MEKEKTTSAKIFKGLVIRDAVVMKSDLGFIYCGDLEKEDKEIAHTITFKWKDGEFVRGEINYDASSICVIEKPQPGLVDISGQGYYSVNTETGMTTGDIVEASGKAKDPKDDEFYLGFRSVGTIAGKAFAVGLSGRVYRLDELKKWTRIDNGLPHEFDIECVHGFSQDDMYAVGNDGNVWHFDGKTWSKITIPSEGNLNAVKCVAGKVYIGGADGVLIEGQGTTWKEIAKGKIEDDIWDIECFQDKIYVATDSALFVLHGNKQSEIDFGKDVPESFYHLSAADGVMWSIGESDIMSFDGKKWTRVV